MPSAAVLERRNRVVELLRGGMSYDEIAGELGYASRAGAWKAAQAALSSRIVESVDELRALEMARLDELQVAVWDRAIDGDIAAGNLVLRIIRQRINLLGLALGKRERKPEQPQGPTSVILPSFWEHVGKHHPDDGRACRCPEIIGDVDEATIMW